MKVTAELWEKRVKENKSRKEKKVEEFSTFFLYYNFYGCVTITDTSKQKYQSGVGEPE